MKIIQYISFLLFSLKSILSLDIHVIPHSHMDPGWLKTYDEYYNQQVRKIFDNVFEQLKANPNRTFVYCEMINFERWYNDQSGSVKKLLKQYLQEKRIEFVGGGLVMNDEASSYYQDIMDQMRVGMEFIKKEFGIMPVVGWMLDPFGHSPSNAYVHSQLGYKYIAIERIEYQDHKDRVANGNLEFLWRPFGNKNGKTIFTHILPFHYGNSFYFRFLSEERAIPANIKINITAKDLVTKIKAMTKGFKHNNFMLLLGDDFTHMTKDFLFQRMETIMNYTNQNLIDNEKYNFFYSTPSKYFEAVERELQMNKIKLHTETDLDFFPYADKEYAYWTGYFTSRPYLKGTAKYLSNLFLTSSNFLFDLLVDTRKSTGNLLEVQKIIGLLQHHDAITGTAKDRVSNDYISLANKVAKTAQEKVVQKLKENYIPVDDIKVCLTNPIINYGCDNMFSLEGKSVNEMIIGVTNPKIQGQTLMTIELAKSDKVYEIYTSNGNEKITSDFFCIKNTQFKYNNTCFLNFFYEFESNVLITSFKLVKTDINTPPLLPYPKEKVDLIYQRNRIQSLTLDPSTDSYLLTLYQDTIQKYNFSLYHGFYAGFSRRETTNTRPKNANPDGAYIFAPIDERPTSFTISKRDSYYFQGKLGTSVITRHSNYTYMISTFFYNPIFVKVDSIIDPILTQNNKTFILGVNSDIDNEITVKYNTSKGSYVNQTQAEFWTDSNGIQMMRRVVNYRHTYNHTFNEKIANNFYPVTTAMSIRNRKDKYYFEDKYTSLSRMDKMITVFSDRPQSGGALKKGEMMLMLLRSGLVDDVRGVNERLYETMSSRIYFKIANFIMFGRTMFAKDLQAYETMNFVYNYMHNSPMLFKAKKEFPDIHSYLDNMVMVSNNVIHNIQILSDNEAVLQFYNRYDYYFTNEANPSGGMVSLRVDRKKKISMTIDYNGVNCLNTESLRKADTNGFLKQSSKSHSLDFIVKPNDFVFVHIVFES